MTKTNYRIDTPRHAREFLVKMNSFHDALLKSINIETVDEFRLHGDSDQDLMEEEFSGGVYSIELELHHYNATGALAGSLRTVRLHFSEATNIFFDVRRSPLALLSSTINEISLTSPVSATSALDKGAGMLFVATMDKFSGRRWRSKRTFRFEFVHATAQVD